jgi:hypothetical protein
MSVARLNNAPASMPPFTRRIAGSVSASKAARASWSRAPGTFSPCSVWLNSRRASASISARLACSVSAGSG